MVVVDSTVWIHYLRTPDTPTGQELVRLQNRNEVLVVGVVMAEVLRGARDERQLAQLVSWLEVFPYIETTRSTWSRVGRLSLALRTGGLIIPLTDLVVAALAMERDVPVYTLDEHFQRIPELRLHQAALA